MRYLKYFENTNQLEELAKNYLANLSDLGIIVKVTENLLDEINEYSLVLSGNFKVSDIKDDLYQFINIMKQYDYIPNGTPTMAYRNGYDVASRKISLGELLSKSDRHIYLYYRVLRINIPLRKFKIKK